MPVVYKLQACILFLVFFWGEKPPVITDLDYFFENKVFSSVSHALKINSYRVAGRAFGSHVYDCGKNISSANRSASKNFEFGWYISFKI